MPEKTARIPTGEDCLYFAESYHLISVGYVLYIIVKRLKYKLRNFQFLNRLRISILRNVLLYCSTWCTSLVHVLYKTHPRLFLHYRLRVTICSLHLCYTVSTHNYTMSFWWRNFAKAIILKLESWTYLNNIWHLKTFRRLPLKLRFVQNFVVFLF